MKKFLLPILLLAFNWGSLYSQQKMNSMHTDSLDARYGHLKIGLRPGWVNDLGKVFTPREVTTLDSIISSFEKETGIEIVVLTADTAWALRGSFDQFSLYVFNKWGIGKKGLNNGIMISFSTALRAIRIENGYGISDILSDTETQRILNEAILPEFSEGNYFEGIRAGLLRLMEKLKPVAAPTIKFDLKNIP